MIGVSDTFQSGRYTFSFSKRRHILMVNTSLLRALTLQELLCKHTLADAGLWHQHWANAGPATCMCYAVCQGIFITFLCLIFGWHHGSRGNVSHVCVSHSVKTKNSIYMLSCKVSRYCLLALLLVTVCFSGWTISDVNKVYTCSEIPLSILYISTSLKFVFQRRLIHESTNRFNTCVYLKIFN